MKGLGGGLRASLEPLPEQKTHLRLSCEFWGRVEEAAQSSVQRWELERWVRASQDRALVNSCCHIHNSNNDNGKVPKPPGEAGGTQWLVLMPGWVCSDICLVPYSTGPCWGPGSLNKYPRDSGVCTHVVPSSRSLG
jgi:hypothetical protein